MPADNCFNDAQPRSPSPDALCPSPRWLALIGATVAFIALWAWQVRSFEGFLEADACTHYLLARFALAEPYRLVDIWGRPFKTLLFALPAALAGRTGVQTVSLLLALTCASIAFVLARKLGLRHPELAYGFTLAQPLVFLHSFSELTELPFAALLGLTALAVLQRRWGLTVLLAGLLPLARPEGFGFLLLTAAALVVMRPRPSTVLLAAGLGWALAAWSVAGWQLFGRDGSPWTWLPRHWPYAAASVYTPDTSWPASLLRLLRFPLSMPAVVGPAVFPALLTGIGLMLLQARLGNRIAGVVLTVGGSVLLGHSLLYAMGAMASNGELRYMLIAAPFWAVLTAAGWEALFRRLGCTSGQTLRWAVYAAAVPLLVNFRVYTVLPLSFDDDWHTARRLALWASRFGPANGYPNLMAAHPGVWYFLDRSNTSANTFDFTTPNLLNPPPGTLLLYDPVYARFNASRDRRVESLDVLLDAGWTPLPLSGDDRFRGWAVLRSRPIDSAEQRP